MHDIPSLKKGQCDTNAVRVKKKLFHAYFFSISQPCEVCDISLIPHYEPRNFNYE